jgi:ABC-type antimicrobial peptide transport system permease subunit
MKEHLGFALLPARLAGIVLGGFGAFCLLLLAVGLHGVVAYTVSQRRREVGIRVAIGAEPRSATTEIMREEIRVVLAGVVMGIGGALAASRLLEGVLYSGKAVDPMVLLGAALFLMVVAAIACYSPARRAAQVDPVQALRSE